LQAIVPDLVDKHRRSDLHTVPTGQLRVAGEADGVLLHSIGDLICLTALNAAGVRLLLLEMRRRADGGDLGELAATKLENGLIGPERAAGLQSDHHPAFEGPPAVRETHPRGTRPLRRQSFIALRYNDIREVRGVGRVVDV